MVAQVSTAAGLHVPAPAAAGILKPGEPVRLRLDNPVSGWAQAFAKANGIPNGPRALIVIGVLREEGLYSSSLLYRVSDGAGSYLVLPELLTRIEPPKPERADEFTACECAPNAARPLAWVEVNPDYIRSLCGRFELEVGTGLWTATDLWTGERSAAFGMCSGAENWCAARTRGVPLTWGERRGTHAAELDGYVFSIVKTLGTGKYITSDPRLATANGLSSSPAFDSVETAKRWCEVRAACALDGDPRGTVATKLKYVEPLPI